MNNELEIKIQRNELRLQRYKNFNWKKYFLKTFAFLLILDIFMFTTVPQDLSNSEFLLQLAISLWVMLLVCAFFTPIIGYWYQHLSKKIIGQLDYLNTLKSKNEEIKNAAQSDM